MYVLTESKVADASQRKVLDKRYRAWNFACSTLHGRMRVITLGYLKSLDKWVVAAR